MDEITSNIQMHFHPLMDLDENYMNQDIILQRDTIRVLTYNIFLRPPPVKNNENDWKDERLADFSKIMNNFDVICLQEMFGTLTSRREQLIRYAHSSGFFFSVDVPAPTFFSKTIIDGGLLILSRFPIIESEFHPFRYCVLSCSIVEKGVLYAKIQIQNSYLIVFNLHLQSCYFDVSESEFELSHKTRILQVQEAADFILKTINERKIQKEDRILLMGDFNIDAHCLKNKLKNLQEDYPFNYNIMDEYSILEKILNRNLYTVDLIKQKFENHPYTYGVTHTQNLIEYSNLDINNKIYDKVLTDKSDCGCHQTLDYIFDISRNESDLPSKHLKIINDSTSVEEFLIMDKPFQTLSDHFGLSVELELDKN